MSETSHFADYCDWIRHKGESVADAWRRYAKSLERLYSWKVESPEDFADWVIIEAGATFQPEYRQRYPTAEVYVFAVARKRWPGFAKRAAGELPENTPAAPRTAAQDLRVEPCFQKLSAQERALLLEYHDTRHAEREHLLERFNIPNMNALRVRVSRILDRLQECMRLKGATDNGVFD